MAALRRVVGWLVLLSLPPVLCGISSSKPPLACGDDGSERRCSRAADEELLASGRSSTRVLNAERRVFTVDGFMTDAEMNHVISVAATQFTEDMGGSEAWRTAGQYVSTELRDWADDPVLRTIEERVAWMVKIPVHAAESSIMVGYTPPPRRAVAAGSAPPRRLANVHHDKNTAPGRVMTALVYLTDVDDGGQTIFPCHSSDGNGTESKTITRIRERFVGAYWDSKRILFPPSDRDCFDAALFAQTEAMCDESDTSGVLAVWPKRGRGLFFASVQPDGSADPTMWHGGCSLGPSNADGQGKWTLQKFREFPPQKPLHTRVQGRSLTRVSHPNVPVEQTVGRGCGGHAHEMRCEENLFRWARSNGAYIADGVVAAHGSASTGGRGLVALDGLKAGAIAFRIPRWLQMTYAHACQSTLMAEFGKHRHAGSSEGPPLCPNLLASPTAHGDIMPAVVVLGLYLLFQRNLGESSVWWPYIAALPASYPGSGLAFTDADLALLDGTVVAHQFLQSLRALHSNHNDLQVLTAELRQLLLAHTDLAQQLGLHTNEAGPGWEERWGVDACAWAIATIRSRSWDDEDQLPVRRRPSTAQNATRRDLADTVPAEDSPRNGTSATPDNVLVDTVQLAQQLSGPALVPIADLANHGPGGNLLGQSVDLGRQLRIGRTNDLPKGGVVADRYLPASYWVSAQSASASPSTENSLEVIESATSKTDRSAGQGANTRDDRREFGSLVPLAAAYGVFDPDSYVLPITLMSEDSAPDLQPDTARHMLWEYGCMSTGFLPLGRTGEDGFTERLLACLRLDCMDDDESTVSTKSKAAGLALLAAKGVARANARMVGAAGEVERCATRKAQLQLSEGLSYYNDGPAASDGTASPWPSLAEEADIIAWLSAEGAGASHTGVVGPWAALQGHINVSSVRTDTTTRPETPAWDKVGLGLQAQRRREWLLVSLRRWEHAAYAAAYDEAVVAAQAAL